MSRSVGLRSVLWPVLGLCLAQAPQAAAQTCGFAAGGTITGIVNTYYPGVSVNTARTQVTVDTANRFPVGNPAIAAGDMILIIQMQDAQIDATNADSYGSGVAGGTASGWTNLNNAGLYEYAVATSAPNGAGLFTVAGANAAGDGTLIRRYFTTTTPSTTRGQRTFQVVRVPQYSSATLGAALTAGAWNGAAGGILAIDASGTLTLNGATVNLDGLGFRGGVGRARAGSPGTAATDYITSVTLNPNGMKGEGIAGTPDIDASGADGYPNGDMARGAPATAGGGGTDGNPTVNDQNSGGGGGGNWGTGGQGGHGWLNDPSPCPPLTTGSQTGGHGGTGVNDATRLFVGSGAGAGSRNNAGPSGAGAGGGMLIFRLGAATGSATLTARGTRPPSGANDGNGGGGAGGAIVVIAATGNLNGLTANASGGQGGYANLSAPPAPDAPPGTSGSHHGPGGGGGGGLVRLSSAPVAPATTSVLGGSNGLTNTCPGDNTTQAYGATAGGNGNLATNWNLGNLTGVRPCTVATRASILGLSWDTSGRVEFATGSQRRTRGFNVYGSDSPRGPEGAPLNGEVIPAERPNTSEPTLYRTDVGLAERYLWIEELETTGGSRFLGPYDREDDALPRAFEDVRQRVLASSVRRDETRRERAVLARAGVLDRMSAPRAARSLRAPGLRTDASAATVRALRIEVPSAGVVRLSLADLQAQGLPEGALALRNTRLSLLGRPVPYRVESGSLVFQAEAFSTDYTDHASYVLSWGPLAPRPLVPLTRSEFPRTPGYVRVEENQFYAPYLPRDTDPWIWDVAVAGWGGGPWTFDLPGLQAQNNAAPVRLRVVGGTAHHHRVQATVNGVAAGEVEIGGIASAVLVGSLPAGVLRETGNTLELAYDATGDAEDLGLLYLDALDLGVRVSLPGTAVQPVRIVPYDSLVPAGRADYLIVTPAAFRDAAEKLAAMKRLLGLSARVLVLERIYDHYSSGMVEAQSVRAALADAYTRGRARYALLLGDDTLDPRGYLGPVPDAFVPSLNGWDGEFGRVPAENLYADVDGDGRPELAIGRLPANTVEEASLLVNKIGQQAEKLARASGRQLFTVDRSNGLDSQFRDVAQGVASRYFAGRQVAFADVGEGIAAARADLIAGLKGGAETIHYFGHGGAEEWSDSALLTVADAEGLQGTGTLAVVFSWACEAQWFQYHLGPSVNEALLLAPDGGAVAAFGPAGISDPQLQRPLFDAIYTELGRGLPLGDAIRLGKTQALKKNPKTRAVVEGFNLLGDPALRLPGHAGPAGVLR